MGIVRRPYATATDQRFAVLPRGTADIAIGPAEGAGPGSGGAAGGGGLRAAVFGVNDGLVSNASLILGVAGAGSGQRPRRTRGEGPWR